MTFDRTYIKCYLIKDGKVQRVPDYIVHSLIKKNYVEVSEVLPFETVDGKVTQGTKVFALTDFYREIKKASLCPCLPDTPNSERQVG